MRPRDSDRPADATRFTAAPGQVIPLADLSFSLKVWFEASGASSGTSWKSTIKATTETGPKIREKLLVDATGQADRVQPWKPHLEKAVAK